MYRFLATPRWLGLAALGVALMAIMAGLGWWQLERYEVRSAINARIDAATTAQPVPVAGALPADGHPPPADEAWARVTATGVYDPEHEILARSRTVNRRVGYEVLTPLRLADGRALLVNRGWVPVSPAGVTSRPDVPPAPSGLVTVIGRVHLSESGARPVERPAAGGMQVRRVGVPEIARELPYPVYGAYVLADPVEPGFVAVPVRRENAWQNAAYVVQWWLLAALVPVAFGHLARREAQSHAEVS